MRTLNTVARVITMATFGTFIGCASKSPTAPNTPMTTSPAPTGAFSTGATLDGAFMSGGSARTVSIAGTSLISTVDGSGHFGLQGIPTGDIQLQIAAASGMATVTITNVAMQEHIHVSLRVNGSSVDVNEHERETPDNRVEIEGLVTAVDATSHQLTVSTFVVSVPAGTPIRRDDLPIQFGDLHVGDRVEIHGMKSGATITATSVNDETEGTEPPEANNDDGADHDAGDDSHTGDTHEGHDGSGHDSTEDGGHR